MKSDLDYFKHITAVRLYNNEMRKKKKMEEEKKQEELKKKELNDKGYTTRVE